MVVAPDLRDGKPPEEAERESVGYYLQLVYYV